MGRRSRFPAEVGDRAVRLVIEDDERQYGSQWLAINAVCLKSTIFDRGNNCLLASGVKIHIANLHDDKSYAHVEHLSHRQADPKPPRANVG